jgi:hypothetical protein
LLDYAGEEMGFIGRLSLNEHADFTIRAVVTSELQQLSIEALELIIAIDTCAYFRTGERTRP